MAGIDRIIKILMNRDDLSKEEATEVAKETKEMVESAIRSGDYTAAEDIFQEELGLEIDYMVNLLL